jgi:hypothetical protein
MTHFAKTAGTGAATALIGAIAIAGLIVPAQASGKTGTEQFAGQICQSVVRVQPGESEFEGCVSSLASSMESVSRNRAVARARDACFAQRPAPGSTILNLCLLRAADTKPDPTAVELPDIASATAGVANDPQFTKSYFAVTPDAKFRREQQACARLGFDPAFGTFANCVADLQSTLQGIDTAGD